MAKVVVTDSTFNPLDIETGILSPLGMTVVAAQCRRPGELIDVVHDAEYVLTQFAPVDAEVIASMRRARVIVRYGIGVDNVDIDAAKERHIPVCNVPDYCIDEVADHTLAMILAATRQVVANADVVRNGNWGLGVPLSAMICLKSRVVGVVGFGRIGREVAGRLRSFKSRVLVMDPVVAADAIYAAGCEPATWDELLAESDIITLHCPANSRTRHLINSDSIASMKPGAILINVARGAVVNTEHLLDALRSGQISFAALDVIEMEPLPPQHPLRAMKNVIVHSHIASVSEPATTSLRRQAAETVACAVRGEPLPNVVNGVH